MAWTIEFEDKARKQLKKLAKREAERIVSYLEERVIVLDNPREQGEALQGARLGHLWRYRVGDYRVVCDIQDKKLIVLVVDVDHRRQVYR